MNDNVVYVYFHVCPDTRKIVYVGRGTNERAWRCTTYGGAKDGRYGHRSPEHTEWCQDLIKGGFVPSDWVHIKHRNLSLENSKKIEKELIDKYKPQFNKPYGAPSKLIGYEKEIKGLRDYGHSYSTVAEILTERGLPVKTMTVWRFING